MNRKHWLILKAARGTDGRFFPWGNAWEAGRVSQEWNPVGRYPQGASPYGALDVVGSVSEWTLDSYQRYPGSALPAPAPAVARGKVIRGQYDSGWEAVVVKRGTGSPERGRAGFRCVQGGEPANLATVVVDYRNGA
jgi:formylglycine-generating enzyme required for sulfatase activity